MSYKTPQEALTEQIRMMDMRYKILAGRVELAMEVLRPHAAEHEIAKMVLQILEGRQ